MIDGLQSIEAGPRATRNRLRKCMLSSLHPTI
jgi:hypothetical protein